MMNTATPNAMPTAGDTTIRIPRSTRWLLRAEALGLLAAAVALYAEYSGDWVRFALLFLLPDLGMLAYLAGPRIGALGYNATHTTLGALGLAIAGYVSHSSIALSLGLIWLAHIGFDRALGYGLKSAAGFGQTHLGRLRRPR